ncbi:MAG: hypothetical protein EOO56_18660 [Hymenobacter sp.]|nr:MAG: hypothetical protein EOO56_18660 [Hymenobacter sp.]
MGAHPAFRLPTQELIAQHLKFLPGLPPSTIGYQLIDHAGGDFWPTITVLFNGTGQVAALPVPAGKYNAVLRGLKINQHGLGPVVSSGTVEVAGSSALVLVQ